MKLPLTVLLSAVLSCGYSQGSKKVLTGKITSCKDGKPLAFANLVLLKDFSGTTTDENGEFRLNIQKADSNDTMAISYLGFKLMKEPISAFEKSKMVCLEEAAVLLDEVVVSTKELNHSKLFAKFRVIRDNLFAQESETSISEYNLFLGEFEGTPSFSKYNYDLSSYSGGGKEFYERYHANTPNPNTAEKYNEGKRREATLITPRSIFRTKQRWLIANG